MCELSVRAHQPVSDWREGWGRGRGGLRTCAWLWVVRLRSTARASASEPIYAPFHVEVELEEGGQVREVLTGPGDPRDPRDPSFQDEGSKGSGP